MKQRIRTKREKELGSSLTPDDFIAKVRELFGVPDNMELRDAFIHIEEWIDDNIDGG